VAHGPIALCEVQGYVYAARRAGAALAAVLGRGRQVAELAQQAETLRQRFERAFWCEELSTYALALDGDKRPCQVRTSNAGQCLFTGIASPERARRVARMLTSSHSGLICITRWLKPGSLLTRATASTSTVGRSHTPVWLRSGPGQTGRPGGRLPG
jgi:hypothetical protein